MEGASSRMWKGSCPAAMLSSMLSVVKTGSEIVAEGVLTNDGSCGELVEGASSRTWKGSCPAAMLSNITSVVRKGSAFVAGGVLTNDES